MVFTLGRNPREDNTITIMKATSTNLRPHLRIAFLFVSILQLVCEQLVRWSQSIGEVEYQGSTRVIGGRPESLHDNLGSMAVTSHLDKPPSY